MQRLRWINKPLSIGGNDSSTLRVKPTSTPPSSSTLRERASRDSPGQLGTAGARATSPTTHTLPRNSPAPEGQGGPWGLSAWTLTLDTCTGLAGLVFSASTLCHEGHKLAGRGSQYPSLAGQVR